MKGWNLFKRQLDNRGSMTVLTLVAVLFLGILGTSILGMTHINMQMKAVNQKTQENFYDTDSILDEIKAGLAETSSKAVNTAYTKLLEDYANLTKTTSLSAAFDKLYLNALVSELDKESLDATAVQNGVPASGTATFHYSKNVLENYLSASDATVLTAKKNALKYNATKALLEVNVSNRTLVLKNVEIRFTNNSYETLLQTDIRMEVPEFSFTQEDIFSEYTKYALLADDQIVFPLNSKNKKIYGNIYAGTKNRGSEEYSNAGILLLTNNNVTLASEKIITRGDIFVKSGYDLVMGIEHKESDCEIWAENLIIGTSGGDRTNTRVDIFGKAYIADDMELLGDLINVKIVGEYNGYHSKDTYAAGEATTSDASHSSSILINGRDNSIDMSQITKLVLAGTTFISRSTGVSGITNNDILMGESLTVKSGQMAYYVPQSYVTIKEAGATGTFPYSFSDGTQYAFDIKGYEKYLGFSVSRYLNTNEPVTRYYLQESGSRICYYYVNFKDTAAAAEFNELYVTAKKTVSDTAAKYYLGNSSQVYTNHEPGITLGDGKVILAAGNILTGEKGDTQLGQITAGTTNQSAYFDSIGESYGRTYKSRQLALIANATEAATGDVRLSEAEKKGNSLFEKIVNKAAIESAGPNGIVYGTIGDTDVEGAKVWIVKGDYTYSGDGNGKGIIVATGKVTLKASFEGMVIAGEDIEFDDNDATINIKANEALVQKLFAADINNKFRKYFNIKNSDEDTGYGQATDYSTFISYENWKKNEE